MRIGKSVDLSVLASEGGLTEIATVNEKLLQNAAGHWFLWRKTSASNDAEIYSLIEIEVLAWERDEI